MPTSPPGFADLDLSWQGPNDLSPVQDALGIRIAVPMVAMGELPLCSTVTLTGERVAFHAARDLVIVAVHGDTARPHASTRGQVDDSTDQNGALGGVEAVRVRAWFNLDVAELCRLPDEPGVYYVFAVLGDLQSNVCRVQWEGR
jgi:hypothetical protein